MPAPRGASSPSQQGGLIAHLNAQAPTKTVNTMVGVSKYHASAQLLLRQAASYRKIRNQEQLYVMLMRFASLVLETIPKHKDFSAADPQYVEIKNILVNSVFSELESLKLSILTRDVDMSSVVARSTNRPPDVVRLTTSALPQLNWDASAPPRPAAMQQQQQEPNVDDLLEIMNAGPGGRAPPPPPPQQGRQQLSLAVTSSLQPPPPPPPPGQDAPPGYQPKYLLHGGQDRNTHALFYTAPPGGAGSSSLGARGTAARYPSLDHLVSTGSLPQQQHGMTSTPPPPPGPPPGGYAAAAQHLHSMSLGQPSAGPPLGPQEVAVYGMDPALAGMPGSCSDPHPSMPGPAPPEFGGSLSVGAPGGGPKELVKRAQLRDVHVSVALMEQFLSLAKANTARGIETCGILAATLSANDSTFIISTLIIPKQRGTTDTVEMHSEEEVLMVHLEREMYPLGWIHTHPTQTCFLSSVDVHTQCSYQTMLDEAVAIVMAPTDKAKRCGMFRLTTPGGLSLVQGCDRRGFHQHPPTSTGQEEYELCGHVYLNDRVRHDVVDLR